MDSRSQIGGIKPSFLMGIIRKYNNSEFEALTDGVISFFDHRKNLHTNGISLILILTKFPLILVLFL